MGLGGGGKEGRYEAGVAETLDDFGRERLGGCSQGGGSGSGEPTRRHVMCRRFLVMNFEVRGDARNGNLVFSVSGIRNAVAYLLRSWSDLKVAPTQGDILSHCPQTKCFQVYSGHSSIFMPRSHV
jgi:hypothetical protein